MFKSARAIVVLCVFTGVSAAAVVGWVTGFFAQLTAFFGGLWNNLLEWINSPLSWDHLFAGAGILLVPVAALVIIFALADN